MADFCWRMQDSCKAYVCCGGLAWLLQEKAKAMLRRQMKHVMFTEPEVIQAGERVTVYYAPDDTNLSGTR